MYTFQFIDEKNISFWAMIINWNSNRWYRFISMYGAVTFSVQHLSALLLIPTLLAAREGIITSRHALRRRHLSCCDVLGGLPSQLWQRFCFDLELNLSYCYLSLNFLVSKRWKERKQHGAVQRSCQWGWESHAADEKARKGERASWTT